MTEILLNSLLQGMVFLFLAPILVGTLYWSRERLNRRQAPRPWQQYSNLLKLFNKQPNGPGSASFVFWLAPLVVFGCYASLGLLVPLFWMPSKPDLSVGDLLLIIYLLALARFALGLAGLDAGAPFGGLGSSRELFVNLLAEPTLILIALSLTTQSHTSNLLATFSSLQSSVPDIYLRASLLILLLPLFTVALAESGRLPFDNPEALLELPMFGKAIYLEYSGPALALLEWGESLRGTFFILLLLNTFFPWLLPGYGQEVITNLLLLIVLPIKLALTIVVLAIWESLWVRLRVRAIVFPAVISLCFAIVAGLLRVFGS